MNRHALRLVARLAALQFSVHVATFLLIDAFAPRVLLLDPSASTASSFVVLVIGGLTTAFSMSITFGVMARLRPALRSLAVGSSAISAEDVLFLNAAPARLALANATFSTVLALTTLVPRMRPQALDTFTDLTLVLLILTMVSAAALPAYVLMRASVASVLELVAPHEAHAALRRLGRRAWGRVRKRFLAAVAAPVALVALGASLLVDAHARTYEREARVADAEDVARAVFEPIDGHGALLDIDRRGRAEAIEAAATVGYRIDLEEESPRALAVNHGSEGETHVTVPTSPGAAHVRFATARFSPVSGVYLLLVLVAGGLAAILGTRIGAAFEGDVALATREVRRAGVSDVMRGTLFFDEAKFTNVQALLQAASALGGVFREFASAQQRSIDARAATERMRALLLASMSHDLKSPLNAVLGFAELVRRNPLTEPQKESVEIIEQRGRELLMLIDTILDSARVEAGELEVSPESAHVSDVVMSAVLEARDLAAGMDVQILGEIQPEMPPLFADAGRIVQALTAMVMTAARFSDKGVVHVRATLPDAGLRLRVEVETSGEGLPISEREKIFDAFTTASSARRHGGLGLGLQLARSILEIHGGSIEVDTTDRGGMAFRIWLPMANDSEAMRLRASKRLSEYRLHVGQPRPM